MYRILRPRHWIRNYPTSTAWDAFVLGAISRGDVSRRTSNRAKVGGKVVWVGTYPYSYGAPYDGEVMPSARTVDLLAEALAVSGVARNECSWGDNCGPVVTCLDGDDLCQHHANAWARGEAVKE